MSDNKNYEAPAFSTYLIRLLIFCIPVVNVVAAVLWGYAGKTEDVRSFGKAALLVIMVCAVVTLVIGLIAFTFLSSRLFDLIP